MAAERVNILWELRKKLNANDNTEDLENGLGKILESYLSVEQCHFGIPNSPEPESQEKESAEFLDMDQPVAPWQPGDFQRAVVWRVSEDGELLDLEGAPLKSSELPRHARWLLSFDESSDRIFDFQKDTTDGGSPVEHIRVFFSRRGPDRSLGSVDVPVIFGPNIVDSTIKYPPPLSKSTVIKTFHEWEDNLLLKKLAWTLLTFSVLCAAYTVIEAYSRGSRIAFAYDLMRGQEISLPGKSDAKTPSEQMLGMVVAICGAKPSWEADKAMHTYIGGICGETTIKDGNSEMPVKQSDLSDMVKACAEGKIPDGDTSQFCRAAWHAATEVSDERKKWWLWSWMGPAFSSPFATSGLSGALTPLITGIIALFSLFAAAGLAFRGVWFGAVISRKNRISIGQTQVVMWTSIVLAGFAVTAFFNAGITMETYRSDFYVSSDVTLIPSIPSALFLALGIAIASPMLSAAILGGKESVANQQLELASEKLGDDSSKRETGTNAIARYLGYEETGLQYKVSPKDAALTDLVCGEENADHNMLVLSRVQNVVITLILGGIYFAMLVDFLTDLHPAVILSALREGNGVLPSLPDPGASFTALLALSHGTYLVAKSAPSQE